MENEPSSGKEKYNKAFEGSNSKDTRNKKRLALEYALDIRKFEIELYWKRTAYFWTLITVILGGFGFAIKNPKYTTASVILSCIAFVLCWAWIFVNKGSKRWQENWEYHVDLLEDDIIGSLYKTVLSRQKDFEGNLLIKPAAMSVSKINLLVCWYMLVVCGLFLIYVWSKNYLIYSCYGEYCCIWPDYKKDDFIFCLFFTVISFIACLLICHFGKSGLNRSDLLGKMKLKMTARSSIIVPEKKVDQASVEQNPPSA